MTLEKLNENIENIKKAIQVEVKHHFIDIAGKKFSFSKYICSEIRTFSKLDPKNPKWKRLFDIFDQYSTDSVSNRMKAIRQLVNHIQNPFENPEDNNKSMMKAQNPQDVDVTYVKGVGPKVASILNKVGIYTANDLLHYFPRKHLDYATRTKVKDLTHGQEATIFGTIKTVNTFVSPKKNNLTIIKITVWDTTGTVNASWFYGRSNRHMQERYKAMYPKGANIILSGVAKFDDFAGMYMIDKAQATVISGDFDSMSESESIHNARIVPVYPLTESLNVKVIRRAIYNALEAYSSSLVDIIPVDIKQKYDLMDKIIAIKQIHFPDTTENLEQARRRLVFEELFLVQLRFALMRDQTKRSHKGVEIGIKEDGFVQQFVESLPFTLTKAQNNSFNEILTDLNLPEPMQRLLQGDVGSGKTVVACMTLLAGIENGYQGALMAPTEILAEQHYRNFSKWFTPLGLSVGLFVGKHKAKIKKELRQSLKNGQFHLAVGTHALIQNDIDFNNLGIVIIDEQHRFGVKQRAILRGKGLNPEMLTMTATPIPRTLALGVHGDLDITTIDELPQGRKPVKTVLLAARERSKAHDLIRKEIEAGNQAYIVFPLIEESETISAKAATIEAEKLKEKVFPELEIGLVHGKMSSLEKDKVMEDFRSGKYNILVSTTVIEVGVDVPNSTVMIIENAERFGLSQLHQLRGRVGRSDKQSYCILISEASSKETRERLNIMVQTNNGFIIAEKDLQLRGPGEFMGTRQSGVPDLLLADITQDTEILEMAREAAFKLIEKDEIKNYPQLLKVISNKIDEGLDLIKAG
jgi:ATP-dependent DNA helicase RecG